MKTKSAPPLPECIEGPEAFRRFDEGVRRVLSVPHSTLVRRERAYHKKSLENPKRRGPKPDMTKKVIS
jgi:hypothetical protein